MSIHPSIIGIVLFCLLIYIILVWKNPTITIKILRIFTIITSLACVLIYLLIDDRKDFQIYVFNSFLYSYVFFTWFLLYPMIFILSVHDTIKFIKDKNIKYIYYLIFFSILTPYIGLQAHHLYFEKVF